MQRYVFVLHILKMLIKSGKEQRYNYFIKMLTWLTLPVGSGSIAGKETKPD